MLRGWGKRSPPLCFKAVFLSMIRIADILESEAILVRPPAKDKYALIRELVDQLSFRRRIKNPKTALADVISREKEKGTGLEQGVAVPHCRTTGTEELAAAFALVPDGIDFGAIDGQPSRFIFLVISPKDATTSHVQALACMARLLKKDSVQEALLAATDGGEIEKILTENDS